MPTHPDAVGYLNDLAEEINSSWFKMVYDLAAMSGVSVLDEPTLATLFALYTKRASYIGIKPAAAVAAAAAAATQADFLDQLSGFTNFKLLGDTLEISFKKRITLIFGANSSGKSSLCESLKVLATPKPPNRPLQNVRAAGAATPEFRYKFKSDAAQQAWTPAVGYGPRRTTIKYFDTAIAVRNVKNAVEPGRVIVLAGCHLLSSTASMLGRIRRHFSGDDIDRVVRSHGWLAARCMRRTGRGRTRPPLEQLHHVGRQSGENNDGRGEQDRNHSGDGNQTGQNNTQNAHGLKIPH